MKHLKIFEKFSEEESRKSFLQKTGIMDAIYDMKELSLDLLDVRHETQVGFSPEYDEKEMQEKTLLFNVSLIEDGEHMAGLFGGHFSFESPYLEQNIYWEEPLPNLEELIDGIKSGSISFGIDFAIVVGEYGDSQIVNGDTSSLFRSVSDMHPEIAFDTINPWDL